MVSNAAWGPDLQMGISEFHKSECTVYTPATRIFPCCDPSVRVLASSTAGNRQTGSLLLGASTSSRRLQFRARWARE
jgi:hypothetical protein